MAISIVRFSIRHDTINLLELLTEEGLSIYKPDEFQAETQQICKLSNKPCVSHGVTEASILMNNSWALSCKSVIADDMYKPLIEIPILTDKFMY